MPKGLEKHFKCRHAAALSQCNGFLHIFHILHTLSWAFMDARMVVCECVLSTCIYTGK